VLSSVGGEPTATVSLFGLPISRLDTAATVALLIRAARGELGERTGRPFRATYVNPHTINQLRDERALIDELRRFDLLYPDGVGLVWAARALGQWLPERVTASDFLPDFCRAAAALRLRVFLVGGESGVADAAARRLAADAPGLRVVGTHAGFFASAADEIALVETIRGARIDACLVGMGSPRQERWILDHGDRLGVPLLWGVGGVFDFYSGRRRRAPQWMMALGLEWLHRMALEPGRLWRRYLLGNVRFAIRTGFEWFRLL
jgi:N-acetylglucosaminyldiphosphoundecaprenol N-acetyl-beta-D-mannosaminyltransferase